MADLLFCRFFAEASAEAFSITSAGKGEPKSVAADSRACLTRGRKRGIDGGKIIGVSVLQKGSRFKNARRSS